MPVKWWVLTEYESPRFLMRQLGPFGIHFANGILYRAEIDHIYKKKPPLSDLTVQLLGPEDWDTAKLLCKQHGLEVGDYLRPHVAFALERGVPIGHLCLDSGTIYVKELEREETFDDGLYLFNLFISPKARRRGIGKFLMTSALEMMGKEDCRYAYTHVSEDNHASRHLVESLGFEELMVVHYLRALGLTSYQTEALPQRR